MKTKTARHLSFLFALALYLAGSGCERKAQQFSNPQNAKSPGMADPLAWLLAPHEGKGRLDDEIRKCQVQLRAGTNLKIALERLGWLFISKAQESFDPGFYKLAEQCALSLDTHEPGNFEAMLLRGHALQNQHRFKEAEPLARELTANRGLPVDYGLLGDVLMEQG